MARGAPEGLPEVGTSVSHSPQSWADQVPHAPSPSQKAAGPVVYFARAGLDGPIKIGFSARFKTRIAQLRTSSFHDIVLLATISGSLQTEHELHQRFAAAHIRGEWFHPVPELLAYVAILPPYVGAVRKPKKIATPPSPRPKREPLHKPEDSVLWQWRLAKGLSRREAAKELQVSERSIENWEAGVRRPLTLALTEHFLREELQEMREKT